MRLHSERRGLGPSHLGLLEFLLTLCVAATLVLCVLVLSAK
jgi:hypothetical protein